MNLPSLEQLLELGFNGLAGLGVGHLFFSNDILELQIILDNESGGENVVVVNKLDERLKSALSIELLGAHAFGNLLGVAFNTNNEGVAELPVLNIHIKL